MTKSRDLGNLVKTGAVQFPDGLGTAGQALQVNSGATGLEFADAGSGTTTVATISALEALSAAEGDMAFVTGTNGLFIKKTAGWYKIATVANDQLQSVTVTMSGGGTSGNPYELALDGTNTLATGAATDPEGLSVTWSAAPVSPATLSGNNIVVSGTNVATLTQGTGSSSNVFTLDPVATTGTHNFSVRFSVTDGVNAALSTDKDYVLNFVTVVANSRYTTMLAQAVGANNGTNSSLTDSSSNNATLTNTGTPVAGTFSPYRGRGYSGYFPDTGGPYFVVSSHADFAMGTGAFTVSMWVKMAYQYNGTVIDTRDGSNAGLVVEASSTQFTAIRNTTSTAVSATLLDTWGHFCWTRDGSGNNKLFVNGVQSGSTFSDTTNYTSQNFRMGDNYQGSTDLKAWVKDVHIVKGYAYEPTADQILGVAEVKTGTVFLGCALPYIGDKSSSPKTITTSNGFTLSLDSPNNFSEYDAADNGGSIYADGSSGASFSQISLSTTFTVECWFYMTASDNTWQTLFYSQSPFKHFVAKWTSSGIELQYYQNITHQTKASLNTWNHAALVSDGTNIYVYLNGVRSTNSVAASQTFTTNYLAWRNSEEFIGYIADARIIDGTAVYSGASFTPPSAPLSSSGADIHIKGTDASIIDKSSFANLTLSGDAKCVTTAVVHNSNTISPKSMYFDGTGDHVILPNDTLALPDTKTEFSMEMWAKFDDFSGDNGYRTLIYNGNESGSTRNFWFGAYTTYGNYRLGWQANGGNAFDATTNISANTWYHIAMVKQKDQSNPTSGNPTVKLFINGAEYATNTSWRSSYAIPSSSTYLGKETSVQGPMKGYIQDFRFRKGYVGWALNGSTYTYPVPTEELKG